MRRPKYQTSATPSSRQQTETDTLSWPKKPPPKKSGDEKLRIMLVGYGFPPMVGGVETHLYDLAVYMSEAGHKVLCLVGEPESVAKTRTERGFTVIGTPLLNYDWLERHKNSPRDVEDPGLLAFLTNNFSRVIGAFGPTVIHTHFSDRWLEPPKAILAAKGPVQAVNTIHNLPSLETRKAWGELTYDALLFVSRHVRDFVLKYHSKPAINQPGYDFRWLEKPFQVMTPGVNLTKFRLPTLSFAALADRQRPRVTQVSRLIEGKGPEDTIEATPRFLRHTGGRGTVALCDPQIVRTAEPGLRERLERRIDALDIRDHVVFIDPTMDQVSSVYHASDIATLPARWDEPLGLAPIEAMAAGTPNVVSNRGELGRIVRHGIEGLVVPSHNPRALGDALGLIATDHELRERCIANGLERAKEFEGVIKMAELEQIYHDLSSPDRTLDRLMRGAIGSNLVTGLEHDFS